MKIFSTLVFACILMHVLNAQPLPNYLQTTTFGNVTAFSDGGSGDSGSMNFMGGGGGGYGDSKLFSEYDSDGNICSAGVFVNTVDFDPGSGVTSFTATGNDGFIQKLTPDGELLWVKAFAGTGGFGVTDIAVDANDFVYASVYFNGTLDFDPGIGVASITSGAAFNNSALVKLDANGEFVWVKHFSNTTNELSGTIYLDTNTDNVFVTGVFSGTSDFDPGSGVVSVVSGGSWDGYMVLMNSNGDYITHFSLGVTGYDSINQVLLDNDGNLYMLGTFAGTVDFDFTAGVYTQTSGLGQANTFISKYSSDGLLQWAKMLGGTYTTAGRMCMDVDQNLYYSSSMTYGTVDVDPGPDVVAYENINGGSLIVKLNSDGSYLHHAGLTGGTQAITGLSLFSNGSLYVQGYFNGVVDFDPGTGISEFTSAANQEFIWMLNSDLAYFNVFTRPNTWPTTIRIEGIRMIVAGVFTGSVDFDPTSGSDTQIAGDLYSFYISEFNFCQAPTFGSIDISSCGNYTSPSGLIYTASGVYTDTIPNSIGCDSIITINLTYVTPVVPSVEITSASNSICQGEFADVYATPINGGNNPTYQWYVNDLLYDTQGPSINSVLVFNLDEVMVIMTSSESCLTNATDTSNVIQFTVGNPGGTAGIFISAYPSNILCSTDSVVFNSEVYNPGNNPSFVWTVNGQVVGDNSSEFVLTNPEDEDIVMCTLESSDICLISTVGESEPITLDVTESMIPEISITGPQIICEGYNLEYTAEISGEGSNPMINWYVNGFPDPVGTGISLTLGALLAGDELTAVLINNDFCAEPVFDVSNEIVVELYAGGDPAVAVNPSLYDVCLGEPVTFAAVYINGGDNPLFQWYLDGMPVDNENSDTFTINEVTSNTVVMCEFSTSIPCTNSGVVYSDPVTVTVHNAALTELFFQKCPDESIVVGGVEYTDPGFYIDSLNVTFFGCDSILHITISNFESPDLDVFANENTLMAAQAGMSYQWLDCNNNFQSIEGATAQSFSPAVTGSYAVEITANGCSYISDCVDITIIGVDERIASELIIYPNPAYDRLYVAAISDVKSIVVEDMAGKIVYYSESLQNAAPVIEVDQFASGVYVVRVTSQSGQKKNALFIKD